jgi:hypothetical protein
MTRKFPIKGYRLKAGKLVSCYKHLPVNIQLQKRASRRVKGGKSSQITSAKSSQVIR